MKQAATTTATDYSGKNESGGKRYHYSFLIAAVVVVLVSHATTVRADWTNTLSGVLNGVSEATPIDTVLGRLGYFSPTGGVIVYSTTSTYFRVDPATGEVRLAQQLSYRNNPTFIATFSVVINDGMPVNIQVIVNVKPANHPPKFDSNPYRFSIKDNTPIGTVIYSSMNVIDPDIGANGTITVFCDIANNSQAADTCSNFNFTQSNVTGYPDRQQVNIFLLKPLNLNVGAYSFALKATDQGTPPLSDSANVTVTVENSQDSRPIFMGTPYFVSVSELGNDLNAALMTFQVKDERPAAAGNNMVFSIDGDTKNWFALSSPSVSGDTYSIQLRRNSPNINLVDNNMSNRYTFNIKATQVVNGQITAVFSQTVVNVNLNDINNNPPRFSQNTYTANVSEGLVYMATVSGLSIIVTDSDLQDNAFFEISIDPIPPLESGIFQVSPTSGQGTAAIAILVTKPEMIRYEDPNRRILNLTITARESKTTDRLSSAATIILRVTSPNNHAPYFPNVLNPITISDDTLVGSTISSYVQAKDDDQGDFGKITYSLSSTDNSNLYFSIDPQTGVLLLNNPLNYTRQNSFYFQAIATDGGGLSASTYIRISLRDHTRPGPVFDREFYVCNNVEMTTGLIPSVTVKAQLQPMISDRVYEYMLIGLGTVPNLNDIFRVGPQTGVVTMVKPVDYNDTPNRQGYFDLPIQASVVSYPELGSSQTIVRVYVLDTNNHPPVFIHGYRNISIPETQPPDSNLTRVTATDQDTGPFGEVRYYIESGSRDDFEVDPFTGDIKVARQPNLKPDQNYNITVIAMDGGQPPLSATTYVSIFITDSVYHNPVFSPDQYTFIIIEGTPLSTLVGTVTGTSPDRRAKLSYSLRFDSWKAYKNNQPVQVNVANWFTINPDNGTIRVSDPGTSFNLTDRVTVNASVVVTNPDNNTGLLSAIAPVTIFIYPRAQSNDRVIFSPANTEFYFQMAEQQPVTTVLYRFAAFYLMDNSQIVRYTFTELPGTLAGYFTVVGNTGVLQVAKIVNYLDLPPSKNLTYTLTAYASSPSTAFSTAKVTINILPLNGNKPIFINYDPQIGNYVFRVDSTLPLNAVVGTVKAVSPVNNSAIITYQLLTPSDYFYVDPRTGNITLNKRLDSPDSQQLVYLLRIQAASSDLNSFSTSIVQIIVRPLKILLPIFTSSLYQFPGQAGYSGPIGQVVAYDPNPFNKSAITYSIVDVTPGGQTFAINPTTGLLNVTSVLPPGEQNYTITIQGADQSVPPLVNTTKVVLSVTQISSNHPEFVDFNPTVNIYQEQNRNDPVTVFKVNPQPGQKVNFSLASWSNGYNKFYIDPLTGALMINGSISQGDVYNLFVIAGNGIYSSTKELGVNVYSNAPPTFACKQPVPFQLYLNNVTGPLDPSLGIQTNTGCSHDKPDTRFEYKIKAVYYNGMIQPSNQGIFGIGQDGTVYIVTQNKLTSVDDGKYAITVSVNKFNDSTESTLNTVVRVTGWDTMAPMFDSVVPGCRGSGSLIKTGVLDLTPFNTPVIQLSAGDCDPPQFRSNVYALTNTEAVPLFSPLLYGENSDYSDRLAFNIDPNTGIVSTNYPDYRNYYRSYFVCQVIAKRASSVGLTSGAKLVVYVTRETSKFRVLFNKPSDLVRAENQNFLATINNGLSANNYELIADPVSTYVDSTGSRIYEKASMCYFILDNSNRGNSSETYGKPVTDLPTVTKLMGQLNLSSAYGVVNIADSCYSRQNMTTKWWSDKWFLWFILIAFSILVFIVALVLTCCVCCYYPMNVKNISKARPYVVLDEPPMSAAGSVFEYR